MSFRCSSIPRCSTVKALHRFLSQLIQQLIICNFTDLWTELLVQAWKLRIHKIIWNKQKSEKKRERERSSASYTTTMETTPGAHPERRMDRENVTRTHTHTQWNYSAIKKKAIATCNNMDGPLWPYAKWNKSDKDKYDMISLTGRIENIRLTRSRMVVARGWGRGKWEVQVSTTLSCT